MMTFALTRGNIKSADCETLEIMRMKSFKMKGNSNCIAPTSLG